MQTPESNSGDERNWDDLLKDIDMSGIAGPGSILDLIYDSSSGTPMQSLMYRTIRSKMVPFEKYFHKQAGILAELKDLPVGLNRSGNDFEFELNVDDEHYPAVISLERGEERWLMRTFSLNSSRLEFDQSGNISEAFLSVQTVVPRIVEARSLYTPKNADVGLCAFAPTKMGLYTIREDGGRIESLVAGNGVLTSYDWEAEFSDEDKRNVFLSCFITAVDAISPANIQGS